MYIMYVATAAICICTTSTIFAHITFEKKNAGITDLTNITIPQNSTLVTFGNDKIKIVPAQYFIGLPYISHKNLTSDELDHGHTGSCIF